MVAILNQKSLTTADLDSGSYVATAGYVRDGIHQRITHLLRDNPTGAATPSNLPDNG